MRCLLVAQFSLHSAPAVQRVREPVRSHDVPARDLAWSWGLTYLLPIGRVGWCGWSRGSGWLSLGAGDVALPVGTWH
jgi:hypothetical protein